MVVLMAQIISCNDIYIWKKKAKYVFGKIQNIRVGFINQLKRTMKIVVWNMWISKNEIHFLKKL